MVNPIGSFLLSPMKLGFLMRDMVERFQIYAHTYTHTYIHTPTHSVLSRGTPASQICARMCCPLAVWLPDCCQASGLVWSSAVGTDARPSAGVDTSLPHRLSRRMKCATVSWHRSPKCQPDVTNPCWPVGPLTGLEVWGC